MKKLFYSLLIAILLVPAAALALNLQSGEEVIIEQAIEDDLYAAGALVQLLQNVNGDAYMAGGKINVDSEITQDLAVAGGDVNVNGQINDDVRIAGGNIRIDAVIQDDLIIGGGNVDLLSDSSVGGDLNVASGTLNLNGSVAGNARLGAGQIVLNNQIGGDVNLYGFDKITFGPNARIEGNFTYRSHEELTNMPAGVVAGEVIFHQTEKIVPEVKPERLAIPILAGFSAYRFFAMLLAGLFLLWIFKRYSINVTQSAFEHSLHSLGIGIVIAILTPIVALILFFTAIGIPLAFFFLASLWLLWFLAKLLAALMIGVKLFKVNNKSGFWRVYGAFGVGAFIFVLLSLIPVIGWIARLLLILIALGALAVYEMDMVEELKKKELI